LTLSSHKTDLCTLILFKIMHDFLQEIYFDFCLKNDMPKHPESSPFKGYLSVDDLMHCNYQLTKYQRDWLKNYSRLWMLMEANVIGFNTNEV